MAPGSVLIVAQESTGGWRSAAVALAASLRRAGAEVHTVGTGTPPRVRTFALTDLAEALLARRAAQRGIDAHEPEAIIYFSVTAALLWPRPGVISLDSIAAENRPGRHGIWQRPLERRRLREAPLLLTWSPDSLRPLKGTHAPALHVPPPVEPAQANSEPREIDVITYAGDPAKRRLSHVLAAWEAARRPGETMVVTGLDGFEAPLGVTSTGRIPGEEFQALLRRARAFVAAPQREDFGIAALEALAAGCQLVTTAAPGPYPALEIARHADPRLVGDEIAASVRIALDHPLPDYAERAAGLLDPYTTDTVDRTVADVVLPRLLARSAAMTR